MASSDLLPGEPGEERRDAGHHQVSLRLAVMMSTSLSIAVAAALLMWSTGAHPGLAALTGLAALPTAFAFLNSLIAARP
jgi:hypothetical protein